MDATRSRHHYFLFPCFSCAAAMLESKYQSAVHPQATLFGTVSRVIVRPEGAWAEVLLHGAGHFYRTIRIPNVLGTPDGHTRHFRTGDRVTLTVTLRVAGEPETA